MKRLENNIYEISDKELILLQIALLDRKDILLKCVNNDKLKSSFIKEYEDIVKLSNDILLAYQKKYL